MLNSKKKMIENYHFLFFMYAIVTLANVIVWKIIDTYDLYAIAYTNQHNVAINPTFLINSSLSVIKDKTAIIEAIIGKIEYIFCIK